MAIILQGNAFVSLGGGGGGGGGSVALANCKGHVHTFDGPSNGFYEIDPPIPDAQDSKALVLGVPLTFTEIVQPTTTLDDKRVLYLFGTAWNDLSVSGILLLGESKTRGEQLTKLMQWYNQNRVSEKRGPVRVSLGTTGIDAYVTGLRLDQANPQTNTQMFSIIMVTADVEA
jgi:hypothetical protein